MVVPTRLTLKGQSSETSTSENWLKSKKQTGPYIPNGSPHQASPVRRGDLSSKRGRGFTGLLRAVATRDVIDRSEGSRATGRRGIERVTCIKGIAVHANPPRLSRNSADGNRGNFHGRDGRSDVKWHAFLAHIEKEIAQQNNIFLKKEERRDAPTLGRNVKTASVHHS